MRCQTCNGTGWVERMREYRPGEFSRVFTHEPCPDCHAGHQHCCDGLTAENDAPDPVKAKLEPQETT